MVTAVIAQPSDPEFDSHAAELDLTLYEKMLWSGSRVIAGDAGPTSYGMGVTFFVEIPGSVRFEKG